MAISPDRENVPIIMGTHLVGPARCWERADWGARGGAWEGAAVAKMLRNDVW